VSRRHYNFGHGIGRSGDLNDSQPKAAGSTVMAQLTNHLLLDLIKEMGVTSAKKCILIPMATGMTIMLRNTSKYVLWSRIDQKACFKSITTADLKPIIVDMVWNDDTALTTDVEEFRKKILELGPENILCLYSTTSCFAPRNCDDIVGLGKLAKEFDIPHLVNNAYGLQSSFYTHQVQEAIR
jgi:O-phospho-L-seryl-tRNASec:L-selenocysteinyl-tRNA synthase